jgi:hypothetical protein
MKREGGVDLVCLETDDEKMSFLSKLIFNGWMEIDREMKMGASLLTLSLKKKGMIGYEKDFQKIRARQIHKDLPTQAMALPEWKIEQARRYPLSRLLSEQLVMGRMKCPFHNGESNNFMVKESGYCFVCGEWCDSIKYMMQIEKRSFREAVEELAGRG